MDDESILVCSVCSKIATGNDESEKEIQNKESQNKETGDDISGRNKT